jgi:hypothetical protein
MHLQSDSPGVVYDLRQDLVLLDQIRSASLFSADFGLAIEYGVVGSAEWWAAVEVEKVPIVRFVGVIDRVDGGPMGDTPTVRIKGEQVTKSWIAWDGFDSNLIGKRIDVRYARLPVKHPPRPGFMVDLLLQVIVLDNPPADPG